MLSCSSYDVISRIDEDSGKQSSLYWEHYIKLLLLLFFKLLMSFQLLSYYYDHYNILSLQHIIRQSLTNWFGEGSQVDRSNKFGEESQVDRSNWSGEGSQVDRSNWFGEGSQVDRSNWFGEGSQVDRSNWFGEGSQVERSNWFGEDQVDRSNWLPNVRKVWTFAPTTISRRGGVRGSGPLDDRVGVNSIRR